MNHPFRRVITALVTPFKNDELDLKAFEKLIEHQIEYGIQAIVIGGSTGEGVNLTLEEYFILIKTAILISKDKLKIIAGSSSSSTKATIQMLRAAQDLGADAIMCCAPPYNRPSQDGLYQHFKALHDATQLPIMLYANLARTGVDFNDDTIIELAKLPRIVALKDYSIERTLRLSSQLGGTFALMTSDDIMALAASAHGGVGVVSILANVRPREVIAVQNALMNKNFALALQLQQELVPIYNSMFIESNPVPVKYAASLMGLCSAEVRLPLCPLKAENANVIKRLFN